MDALRAAPSLLDLDLGFLALPRRLCASPFYRSLRADERQVIVEMLLVARYAEGGEFWFAGVRYPLAPGQFIETEQQIADLAGVTRKTVRTVRRKARNAGFLSWAKVSAAGHCPSVTTVCDYERIRLHRPTIGPLTDTPTGTMSGTPAGHQGALSEQGNPGEPRNQATLLPSPPAPARRRRETSEPDPRHRPMQERLEAVFREVRGTAYGFQDRDPKALTKLLELSRGDLPDTERRWRVALGEVGFRRCDAIHELATKWNAYTGAAPRANGAPVPAMAAGAIGSTGGFGA